MNSDELRLLEQQIAQQTAKQLRKRIQLSLEYLIAQNLLVAGQRLPPTRILAKALKVSRDTIEQSYNDLQAKGLIIRKAGVGSFISHSLSTKNVKASARDTTRSLLSISKRAIHIRQPLPVTLGALTPGQPETRNFPIQSWNKIEGKVLKESAEQDYSYGTAQGVKRLREAIALRLQAERQMSVSADNILVVNSSRQALALCGFVLADADDYIAVEDPSWLGTRETLKALQLKCLAANVGAQGLSISNAQQAAIKALVLTPSASYSIGASLSLEQRRHVLDWSYVNNAWIVEDDYDSEFRFEGFNQPSIHSMDHRQQTLYIGTFSKTMFPDLRIAYIVMPDTLIDAFTNARANQDGHSSQVKQLSMAHFMEEGHFDRYTRNMQQIYATRREQAFETLSSYSKGNYQVHKAACGLQMRCNSTRELNAKTTKRLRALGAIPLSDCYQQACTSGWLLGFAALTPGEMKNAARQFAALFE